MSSRSSTVFRRRVERVYQRTTGKHTAHGALVWFARQIGVSKKTVYAWVDRKNPRMARTPTLILLQQMEDNAPPLKED